MTIPFLCQSCVVQKCGYKPHFHWHFGLLHFICPIYRVRQNYLPIFNYSSQTKKERYRKILLFGNNKYYAIFGGIVLPLFGWLPLLVVPGLQGLRLMNLLFEQGLKEQSHKSLRKLVVPIIRSCYFFLAPLWRANLQRTPLTGILCTRFLNAPAKL